MVSPRLADPTPAAVLTSRPTAPHLQVPMMSPTLDPDGAAR